MSVPLPTAVPQLPLRDQIRMYLRDVPGRIPGSASENILLGDVEFSDAELAFATELMLSEYNTTPPPLPPVQLNNIPLDMKMAGIAYYLLGAESFRQLRNQSSVPEGGVALGIDDKWQSYLALRAKMQEDFQRKMMLFKKSLNMRACWGAVNSAYSYQRYRRGGIW